jgi:hypothetical protein
MLCDMKNEIFKQLVNRAAVIKVNTALNPLLWLTAVVTPTGLIAAILSGSQHVQDFACLIAATPVCLTGLAYAILLFRDPDRLQSEQYQLKQQELILLRKGDETPILIDQDKGLTKSEALGTKTGKARK